MVRRRQGPGIKLGPVSLRSVVPLHSQLHLPFHSRPPGFEGTKEQAEQEGIEKTHRGDKCARPGSSRGRPLLFSCYCETACSWWRRVEGNAFGEIVLTVLLECINSCSLLWLLLMPQYEHSWQTVCRQRNSRMLRSFCLSISI